MISPRAPRLLIEGVVSFAEMDAAVFRLLVFILALNGSHTVPYNLRRIPLSFHLLCFRVPCFSRSVEYRQQWLYVQSIASTNTQLRDLPIPVTTGELKTVYRELHG
ncbi:hypothetical protein ARMGADRAFT_785642 [Armillaria gallica]|uniref:Uncharacterized protein n=1 Tax=Armillaria gallica TaxID=47427 RepID=A0A2H3DW32_ARMGA|nr:hypothetical protein ARMGADRAFT_785642 [Armillaria gallica]